MKTEQVARHEENKLIPIFPADEKVFRLTPDPRLTIGKKYHLHRVPSHPDSCSISKGIYCGGSIGTSTGRRNDYFLRENLIPCDPDHKMITLHLISGGDFEVDGNIITVPRGNYGNSSFDDRGKFRINLDGCVYGNYVSGKDKKEYYTLLKKQLENAVESYEGDSNK